MAKNRKAKRRARTAGSRKTAGRPLNPGIMAYLALALIAIALLAAAYMARPVISIASEASPLCSHGDSRPCASGVCDGAEVCVNGVWSGCRWEQSCVPGSRLPCTELSCAYAVKECNECGTGYGPCKAP